MQLFNRVKLTLISIKKSIERFPITVAVSTILVIILIYLNESHIIGNSRETLQKINLVLGLGIPLSLCIGLLIERFFRNDRHKSMALYMVGIAFLILYYFAFLETSGIVAISRYLATMISLILAFLYTSRIGRKDGYEYYVMDVYSSFALTFIYSFILYFGIVAILFTINQLFDANINGEIYYYMFLVVSLIFAISLFLSKLPSVGEEYHGVEYTKPLKILLTYIVIPLITIYTTILYVYFAKILITGEWPRGLVSHLVLWYSTISVGVIFLITPILEENKVAKMFKFWFPKIILPILFMMFMSIYQRINQYGITENRYYLVVLGLWVLGIMIYFSLKKPLRNIIIPISLSIIMLNSVFGPLSSFAISKYSQNKRFESILQENNMLSASEIAKNDSISTDDKREISNIISYFNNNHKLEDIKILPKDFDLDKMESTFGFKYEPYYSYPYEQSKYFYYGTNNAEDVIDISGYNYYLNMNSWNENNREVDGLILKYNRANNTLTISSDEIDILEQDITDFVKDIYEKQEAKSPNEGKTMVDYKDMSYSVAINSDSHNIDLKFIFTEINLRIDENNNFVIENASFILLISNK
ncbi:DUF4153 domain-containing protein [Tissierella sp.]|uniref:DUF4153 domain-containing protein n=1 Tax=Tissierella sp. TaxID=41274 RepID=UPI002857942D|nr:DUF4153 domain-containing protein [Tissierella sp.]MDR7857250.1 DUF4153 domain-containing protein [Tissierella sp.]